MRRMAHARKQLGNWGESVAATHLEALGYTIEARNWRSRGGEIDLVARRAGWLAFVEVKTRRGERGGSPEAAITPAKARRLIALALQYVALYADDEQPYTIDIVAVELDAAGDVRRVEHIRNAVVDW